MIKPSRLVGLAAAAVLTLASVASGQVPTQTDTREQTADQQVRHVLSRLAFGARPGDYERVRTMGVDAWIDAQLLPRRISDSATTTFLSQLQTYNSSPEELFREFGRPGQMQQEMARARTAADSAELRRQQQESRRIPAELQAARVGRAVASERQLEEVMVDFWLNHFSVFVGKNPQMRNYLGSYERDVIRPHALGNFQDLLTAVAKSPAMLTYLDNRQSQADSTRRTAAPQRMGRGLGNILPQRPAARRAGLNENYARELLELHTLGVDGGYTQTDVVNVARAFTGWSVNPPELGGAGFVFRPPAHDAEPKMVLGHRLRAGRGIEDGEEVLDIVATHPSTAKFIARKLAVRFVSDTPPPALVDRAADVFRKTDGDIREVVRAIVTSPEFFSTAAYRAKVKSPFEVVVSALRAVGAEPDPSPRSAQFVAALGQPIFGRQTPDGWPETGDEWINTGSILNRINFGIAVAAGRLPGAQPRTWPLPVSIRRASREAQVDAVIAAILGGEASPETRAVLVAGENPLLASASADSAEMRMAARRQPPPPVAGGGGGAAGADRLFQQLPNLQGLPQIVGLAIGSPEFQRR